MKNEILNQRRKKDERKTNQRRKKDEGKTNQRIKEKFIKADLVEVIHYCLNIFYELN